ncbi:MAG: hypothetical protein JW715_10395 [Sedimentisphaerales bacterium]|nr:hypothetical protein [Sedimentisphaerales bacterium]
MKNITSARSTKTIVTCLIISLLFISDIYAGRALPPVQMTIHPAKTSESAKKYQLLPKAEELIDADAAPLYQKAVESLPAELNTDQINKWRKTEPDKLPQKQVQAALEQFKPSLQLLEQAAKCKRCEWTEDLVQNLTPYRNIAFLLTLQIRFETSRGRYDKAIDNIRTGYALAKNVSKEPMLIPGLVAVAISAVVSGQIEQFVQEPDAPNLYNALTALPQPLIDLSDQLEIEGPDTAQKVSHITNRMERQIAALQCVEALRLYAGTHNGKFPDKLSDVTEVKVPNDPVTKKPFSYSRTGTEAILELEATEGSEGRDALRYELQLKE